MAVLRWWQWQPPSLPMMNLWSRDPSGLDLVFVVLVASYGGQAGSSDFFDAGFGHFPH